MLSQMLVFLLLLHIIPAKDRKKILVEFLAQQNTHYAQNYAGVIYTSLATCEYAYIWCKCPKKHRCDLTMSWPITDVAKGARTIGEIQQKSKLSKSSKHRHNCCHEPIFPFIPMHRVVIDSLHLFLRIADLLYKLLIRDLRILDGIDSNRAYIKKY